MASLRNARMKAPRVQRGPFIVFAEGPQGPRVQYFIRYMKDKWMNANTLVPTGNPNTLNCGCLTSGAK